jgi:RimJ/RimL family protein N-acetyltransferase
MQTPFLVGSAIYLRPLEKEDARTIVPWFNDAEVTRFTRRYRPLTLAEEEEYLRRLPDSATDVGLGIALRGDDRLVGLTALHDVDPRNRHAQLGLLIGDKDSWGKGYGTEATRLLVQYAFETLNLNRVWLHVYEHNARGLRVYEKVGFRVEGRLRQEAFRDGRYWDTVVMGLLREEWEKTGS